MTIGYRTGKVVQRPVKISPLDATNPFGLECYQTSSYTAPVTEQAAELIIRLGITRQDVKALALYLLIAQYPDDYRHVTRSVPVKPLVGEALIDFLARNMGWSHEFIVKCLNVITYLP